MAGTDYVAKEFSDGTGTTLTGNLTVTANKYTTATQWQIQNTGTLDAYLGGTAGTWQIRGTGIFDDGEQTVESRSTQAYGERILTLDLPYQADRHVAYGIAQLVREQRENPTTIPREVEFIANRSSTLMSLALTAEVGDMITVSNTMTGVSSAMCQIQRIEFEHLDDAKYGASSGVVVRVRYSLAPTSSLTTPTTPTGLAVATESDSQLSATWTNTDATAETEVYVDGALATIAAPAATSATVGSLTRATNYSITLKHVKYALLRSTATGGVTGRPTVIATGGTITTPGDGYKYHTFTTSSTFGITKGGRVSYVLVGGGGGGGLGNDSAMSGGGGGAGQLLQVTDNTEPVGSYSVVLGAGGAGSTSAQNFGATGGNTTYRAETAIGGGGGGSWQAGNVDGRDGGSGGGGSSDSGTGGVGNAGNNGGDGGPYSGGFSTGGGGGGAGSAGSNGVNGGAGTEQGGAGGSGLTVWGTTYAPGGQGGGPGGASGGNATLFGGGGHGAFAGAPTPGGNGKAGIAIFRYPI